MSVAQPYSEPPDRRVVEIWAPGHYASGYAVSADLVLTTRHGLDNRDDCEIRPIGEPTWRNATVVWRGKTTVDAALLRVDTALWGNHAGPGWTRWADLNESAVSCDAAGFPSIDAQREPDRSTTRVPTTVSVSVDPTPASKINRYGVNVKDPILVTGDDDAWRGMSGAVLLAQPLRQIVGVVSGNLIRYHGAKLEAVPALTLLRDPRFAELVGAGPPDLELPADRDTVGLLSRVVAPATTPLPNTPADWQLLLPEHTVVPFVGRRAERTRLRQWCCHTPERLGIGIVTGEGGAGKTRLAVQLCADLRAREWDTGFYRGHERAPDRLWDAERPTLIVVDDPAPLVSDVERLIQILRERRFGPPVRLLLLARADGSPDGYTEADWWQRVSATTGMTANTGRSFGDTTPTVVSLDREPLTAGQLDIHYAAALEAFGGAAEPSPFTDDADGWRQPLDAHFAALLAARGNSVETLSGVRRAFFDRELRLWKGLWEGHWGAPPNAFESRCLLQCVATVALTNPAPESVEALLECVPAKGSRTATQLWTWLRELFPGRPERLVFGPDLLTSQLLETVGDLPKLVLALSESPACTIEQQAAMLESLLLATEDVRPKAALFQLVSARFAELCQAAFEHGDALLADPLDQAINLLCDNVNHHRWLRERAAELPLAELPHRHHGLLATLIALATDQLRGQDTVEAPLRLAGQLIDLAAHAASTGRYDEAIDHLAEALDHYRDHDVEDADFALACQNVAVCLYARGEYADALQHASTATQAYAELSETNPDIAPWLAESLLSIALCAMRVGEIRQAVWALMVATDIGAQTKAEATLTYALVILDDYLTDAPTVDPSGVAAQLVHDRHQIPQAQGDRFYDIAVLIATELCSRCPQALPRDEFEAWSEIAVELLWKERFDASLRVVRSLLISVFDSDDSDDHDIGVSVAELLSVAAVGSPAAFATVADEIRRRLGTNPRALLCLAFVDIAYGTAMAVQEEQALAIPALERGARLLSEVPGYESDRCVALNLLGFMHRALGNHEQALEVCQTSVSLMRVLAQNDAGYTKDLVEALTMLALSQAAAGLDSSGTTTELLELQAARDEAPSDDLTRIMFLEHRLSTEGHAALPDAERELVNLEEQFNDASGGLKRDLALLYAGVAALVARVRATARTPDTGLVLIEHVQRIIEQHHGDSPAANFVRVQILNARGHCHLDAGDAASAIADFTHANEIDVDAERYPLIIGARHDNQLGLMRAYSLSQRPRDAATAARRALDLIDTMNPSLDIERLRGNVMSAMVEFAGFEGDVSGAVDMADAVIAELSTNNPSHRMTLASAHFAKATVYINAQDFESALPPSMAALNLFRPLASRNPLLLALYLETAGNCANALGHTEAKALLWEGTAKMREVRRDGAMGQLPARLVLPAHAQATAIRSAKHIRANEPDEALTWIAESVSALTDSCPLVETNPAFLVLMTFLELFDTYFHDEDGDDELLRRIGTNATTLLVNAGTALDANIPPQLSIRTGWRLLSRMSETGWPPVAELRAYTDATLETLDGLLGLPEDEGQTR